MSPELQGGVIRRKIPLICNEVESNNIRSQYTEDTQMNDPSVLTHQEINHDQHNIVGEECIESTLLSDEIRMSQKAFMSSTQTSHLNTIINRPMIFKNGGDHEIPSGVRNTKTGE